MKRPPMEVIYRVGAPVEDTPVDLGGGAGRTGGGAGQIGGCTSQTGPHWGSEGSGAAHEAWRDGGKLLAQFVSSCQTHGHSKLLGPCSSTSMQNGSLRPMVNN